MVEQKKDNEIWREAQMAFYASRPWRRVRAFVIKRSGGLCEICLKSGIYKAATLAHHIVPVTAENVNDPQISLNPDNLIALCADCHAAIHSSKRYTVDENGNVSII